MVTLAELLPLTEKPSRFVYRIVPLHDFSRQGAPVSGYRVERWSVDGLGPQLDVGRYDTVQEARAAVAAVPAASIDDECAA